MYVLVSFYVIYTLKFTNTDIYILRLIGIYVTLLFSRCIYVYERLLIFIHVRLNTYFYVSIKCMQICMYTMKGSAVYLIIYTYLHLPTCIYLLVQG